MIGRIKALHQTMAEPADSPGQFLARGKKTATKTLVACLGDSITHGVISANYVEALQASLADEGFEFINAGINGDLAYNVAQRLDQIIACKPDAVTLLVGTNDVNATYSSRMVRFYRKYKQLPVEPDKAWYDEQVRTILLGLKAAGIIRIAVLSLPMLGEDMNSTMNYRIREYNALLRRLCDEMSVSYLPLFEQLTQALPEAAQPPAYRGAMGPARKAMFRRLLLGQSWDTISRENGFYFVTDQIHLNDKAASIIKTLIMAFLGVSGRQS